MNVAIIIPNYNSAKLIVRTVHALLEQDLPHGTQMEIKIVDDGSTDDSVKSIQSEFGDRVQLIQLGKNCGRSTARNVGAEATLADLLVFVDSDCVPTGDGFIQAHLDAIERGVQLSFGNITTPGPGFWDRLQRDSARWRLQSLRAGELWAFTTQNVAILRECFEKAGGFNPVFDRHGFEDRDLFIKAAKLGTVVDFTESARVVHGDEISLASVSRKLGEAGLYSAWEFDDLHPAQYSRMHFSRLDCRRRPWLRWLDRLAWPLASRLSARSQAWLEWSFLPFGFRALLARLAYGMSFLHGTATRWRARQAAANASG